MEDWIEESKANAERKAQAMELRLKLEGVVQKLSSTRDGVVFLRWIMSECSVFLQEYPVDDKLAVWNAGRRAFALQILNLCAAVGKADILLAKETENV